MKLTLADIAKLPSVEIINGSVLRKQKVSGVSSDSRLIKPGNLFVALRGEKFDGHQFVADVTGKGAIALLVDRAWKEEHGGLASSLGAAIAVVPDTMKAFGMLARIYRNKFRVPILAVGGSNGKTTTKEMIGAVLRSRYNVVSTEGNLNNHIGVPQMLFRLTPKHDIAVLEFGTNHFGELDILCGIAAPTHVLITNIGREHLEFFRDEKGVAKEETTLFRALRPGGVAFVNGDDERVARAGKKVKRSLTYGTGPKAQVRGVNVRVNGNGCAEFDLLVKKNRTPVRLSVAGLHNATNALAAAAVGVKFSVPMKKIVSALEHYTAVSKRTEVIARNGITILNDTYNANPDSVVAALGTLRSMTVPGKKFVVLADMLELGERSEHEHAKIGLAVSDMEFEYLLTYGPLSRFIHEASKLAFAEHFDTKADLIRALKSQVGPGDAVLVKGSRGMKMEEVVEQL